MREMEGMSSCGLSKGVESYRPQLEGMIPHFIECDPS